jgi:sarcosine dehydrogenase
MPRTTKRYLYNIHPKPSPLFFPKFSPLPPRCRQVPLLGLEAIWRDDRVVGFLRRGDYAFALGKPLGYGYVTNPEGGTVDAAFLKSGRYELERMGKRYPAKIHLRTPFDPKHLRLQGVYE